MASYYQRIFSEFKKLGYLQDSELNERETKKAMDQIVIKNAGYAQFDREIAEEMWSHCNEVAGNRTVVVRDYIQTLLEAESLLRGQHGITQEQIRAQKNVGRKRELEEELNQIQTDHRFITAPFKLPPLRVIENIQEERDGSINGGSQRAGSQRSGVSQRQSESVIFAYEHNTRESSATDLKFLLFITIFVLAWQLILMFHKHHFLNILCIFFVLSIFFLNFFDSHYVKFLLGALGVTVIFDLFWLIFMTNHYWSPHQESIHSTLHTGFLQFIVIMTIILMVLKAVMAGILFKYKSMDETLKKNVSLFGYKIKLDGRPTYNPFTPLLGGRKGTGY